MMRLQHYRKVLSLVQIRNRQFSVKLEIETKVISTEIIKPSSPTPKSLQKHQLSFLDQGAPPIYMPLVYFYSSNPKVPNSQKSDHLKKSLSETLSRFYPLAGRLVGNLYVDCNDSGAPFAEAEANCDLSLFIADPEPERIKKHLLYKTDESSQDLCMTVQATYFRCGGLALGLLMSHKIADGLSLLTFANTWSAAARNGGDVVSPKFDAASYFPPQDISGFFSAGFFSQEDVAAKIFTFPAVRIAALQHRYSSFIGGGGDLPLRRPSRVAALSTYIWTRFIFAAGKQADPTKIYSIRGAVNIRSMVNPPMSEYHFGNNILTTIASPTAGDGGVEVAQKLWEAKKAVYDVVVCAEVKAMEVMNELRSQQEAGERLVSFNFTSLCGFRLYEADFGWGKPVWAVVPGFLMKNMAILSDAKCGDGIEVVLHLSKHDMEKFQANLDLDY